VRLALHGRGAATTSEALNSNSLNILAGVAIPALFVSLGSRTGIETFSVWWLVGMTVVAVALAYTRHGLTRTEGAAIVGLYAAFVAVVATQ
jgi:Ca2+/Na+ antiporter